MKLVRAKATDFAFVKMLYEDDVTDMIYREPNEIKVGAKALCEDWVNQDETKEIRDEITGDQYKFENCLFSPDTSILIVVNEDEEKGELPIGFIRLERIEFNRWRLYSMNIIREYQDISYIKRMLDLLFKREGISDVDVSTTSYSRLSMFIKSGFFATKTVYHLRRGNMEA